MSDISLDQATADPELPIHKRIGYTDQRTLCYSF